MLVLLEAVSSVIHGYRAHNAVSSRVGKDFPLHSVSSFYQLLFGSLASAGQRLTWFRSPVD